MIRSRLPASLQVSILAAATLLFSAPVLANKIQKLDISPLDGFSNAPRIEVYSTDGEKWNRVDDTQAVTFKVRLNAECQFEGKGNKAYDGDLSAEGFAIIGDTEPADFLIPHSNEASATFRWTGGKGQPTDPLKVCADELTKRMSEDKSKTKYHVLSEGFTVNYPGAFEVKYRMYCHATGLGKTDLGSDTTLVNARIHCGASELAKNKIPPKPARMKVTPARQEPLVKSLDFEADPAEHRGDCPVNIRFNGRITANRAGTVTYRYVSHDGRNSPDLELKFDGPGTKATRQWNRTLSEPDAGGRLAAPGGGAQWDHQGWYRLEVVDPKSALQTQANYKVACEAPQPAGVRYKN